MRKKRKIRITAWDHKSGQGNPATQVPIVLEASCGEGTQFLGTLATNQYGYVSFDLTKALPNANSFKAYVLGAPDMAITISAKDLAEGKEHYSMVVDLSAIPGKGSFGHLPAVQDADYQDYQMSPDAFVSNSTLQLGEGNKAGDRCSKLIPNPEKYRKYGLRRLVWDETKSVRLENTNMSGCPDCLPEEYKVDKLCVREGEAIEFEVEWTFLGHSMGEMINSFTLAPCEQMRLATLDWNRQDRLQRSERSVQQESIRQDSNRNFLLQETMDAALREKSLGGSFQTGASANIGLFSLSLGGSISGQTSRRDLASNFMQSLSESVVKSASAIRTNRSTLVVEAGQQESSVVQSRVIRNNNKCHTLNLMYYEVISHYNVKTEYQGSRPVLFVEYCPKKFTEEEVAGYAHIFRSGLLDPSLYDCFDALARHIFCCKSDSDGGSGGNGGSNGDGCKVKASTVQVTISTGKNPPGKNSTISLILRLANGSTIAKPLPLPSGGLGKNSTHTMSVGLGRELCIDEIIAVGLDYEAGGVENKFDLAGLTVQYNPSTPAGLGGPFPIYSNSSLNKEVHKKEDWLTDVNPTIPNVPDPAPVPDPNEGSDSSQTACKADKCCAERLMNHIQQNNAYYNALYWMNEDATQRGIRFSQFEYNNNPLLTQIVNSPLGVVGNWVAFLLADRELTADPAIEGFEEIVYLPTRGIFGEGILGGCGSCETVEPDEFRDFDCKCEDMNLALPQPENNLEKLTGLTASAPANIVQVGGFESAPAANLPGQLTELLKQNGLFNDLTGLENLKALLESLQSTLGDLKEEDGKE